MRLYKISYKRNNKKIIRLIQANNRSMVRQQCVTFKVNRIQRFNPSRLSQQYFSERHKLHFLISLSNLLLSGIALTQALEYLKTNINHLYYQWYTGFLIDKLEQGMSLSQALKLAPLTLNEIEIALIHAAEQSGMLADTLKELAEYRQQRAELKSALIKALSYPCVIISIGIIVMLALLCCVIPRFQNLYNHAHIALPALTQTVLNLSHFVQSYGLIGLGIIFLIVVLIRLMYRRTLKAKIICQRLFVGLPLFGKIWRHQQLALVLKTLSTLLHSGMPLITALAQCEKVCHLQLLKQSLQSLSHGVVHGQKLSEASTLAKLPQTLTQWIQIGETSGDLPKMLQKAAEDYQTQLHNITQQFTTLLEPMVMVILGGLVGSLVIALYLPMFQLGNVI